jgi:uncharacterized protein YjeT (DUF2065 family)
VSKTAHVARIALGLIRVVNGTIGLVAPQIITRRLANPGDEAPPPAAVYALRMFGIRTILAGLELLRGEPRRSQAMRQAPLIHASDLVTAVLVARSGRVPLNAGVLISGISAFNTLLALIVFRAAKQAAKAD